VRWTVAVIPPLLAAATAAIGGSAAPKPAKFDHAAHRDRKVAIDACGACHGADRKGALAVPGRSGHQPCLASGCHVDDFLVVSDAAKKADPARYGAAASFCLGCHRSATGEAPRRFQKAAADNVYRGHPAPEHHVEMDHLAHTRQAGCRDCHVVDARSFQLVAGRPAHAECAKCHGESAPPMSGCATCHTAPGPAAYFAGARRSSDVRSCSSGARPAEKGPCFLHERREHRFAGDQPLQCGSCHFMIADPKGWAGRKYRSLRDIAGAPIIHNQRDLAHQSCGATAACHQRDVVDSRGTARCGLCHSKRVTESIFD
jgi:Class III cytochrome C family